MGAYCDGRILTDADSQRHSRHASSARPSKPPLHRLSLRRPDDDRRRTEGARVQRPPGRSGNAAADAPSRLRSRAAAAGRRTRRAWPSARFEWSPDPSVCVVLASGGYPGTFDTGDADHRHRSCGTDGAVFQAGTRHGINGDSKPPEAASRRNRSGPDLASRHRPTPMPPSATSTSTACTTAATSAAKA